MNKKVLALAVAGALAAPGAALAQVTIGGGFNILFYQHDADNDSASSASDVMESSESEIRITGTEKLGGGTDVWFQCASSADGVVGGVADTTGRVLCTRNSAVGLRGSFGNVFLGNWDTPMKLVQNQARGWFSGTNGLYGGSMILLAGDSQSGASNTGTSFYRRQANSANYQSPNWGGFSIAAAFSASNESQSIPDATGTTPRLMSINGMFRTGPLLLGLAFEKHDDYGQTFSGSDDALSFVVGYRIGAFNIRGFYQANNYEVNAAGSTVETTGFGVYADWNIQGPHTLRFGYATLDDVEGTVGASAGDYTVGPNSGGEWMNVSYTYDFSKRTQFVLSYNSLKSDDAAAYTLDVQGAGPPTLGGKQTSIGVALRHSF